MMRLKYVASVFLTGFLLAHPCASAGEHSRQKVIDFEDEVVEGLNKQPLDSLNAISEKNKKLRRLHLYRKRAGFRTETDESLGTTRYTP